MGCTNPNPKPKSSGLPVQSQVKQSVVEPPAEPAVPKISVEQAERRRSELRKNLEEGKCNPPKLRIPKIQPIEAE